MRITWYCPLMACHLRRLPAGDCNPPIIGPKGHGRRARRGQSEARGSPRRPQRAPGRGPKAPRRDLELETLLQILESERFVTCHSYRQDEINMLMHVADSMGFTLNTFTHILEGYKVADKMEEADKMFEEVVQVEKIACFLGSW